MKPCDACGNTKSHIGIGRAFLCRDCESLVREVMDEHRLAGNPVNALHIAKRMFRESNPIGSYLLRDIPSDLWKRAHHCCIDEHISLRDLILKSIHAYLDKSKK